MADLPRHRPRPDAVAATLLRGVIEEDLGAAPKVQLYDREPTDPLELS